MNIPKLSFYKWERRKRCKQWHNDGLKKKETASQGMHDSSVNDGTAIIYNDKGNGSGNNGSVNSGSVNNGSVNDGSIELYIQNQELSIWYW